VLTLAVNLLQQLRQRQSSPCRKLFEGSPYWLFQVQAKRLVMIPDRVLVRSSVRGHNAIALHNVT
jgi:hypothetical protein